MFLMVIDTGFLVLNNITQMIVGSLLSIPTYYLTSRKIRKVGLDWVSGMVIIVISSLIGVIVPFGIYGIIPIVLALIAAGMRNFTVFPMVTSNALFNLLIPYNDAIFIWKTGIWRLILAFSAGILIGILLRKNKFHDMCFFKKDNISKYYDGPFGINQAIRIAAGYISAFGIYLVVGAFINVIFHKNILMSVYELFYTNAYMAQIPRFFAGQDIINPLFVQAMSIIDMFMDFILISGLLALCKFKGILLFAVYYVFMAALLAVPVLI